MKRSFPPVSSLVSTTLMTASGALLMFACDEFTCEDYATCEESDSGHALEAGAASGTTTGRTTHQANGTGSTSRTTAAGGVEPTTSGLIPESVLDASAPELDAGSYPSVLVDAGEVTTPRDAMPREASDAELATVSDALVNASALGEGCSDDGDCVSGHCADGVCCESACDGVCSACDQVGTRGECSPIEHDDACVTAECPASTECRAYELTNTDTNCEAMGVCRTESECEIDDAPSGTPCADNTGTCNGAGECVVPDKLGLGEDCSDAAECGSGHCALGAEGSTICCSTDCDQTCQVCSTDGQCNAAPANDDACEVVCPVNTA